MLKKIVKYTSLATAAFLITGCMGNTQPKMTKQKSNKFKIDEIVILPHPGKFIKKGNIKLTNEQYEELSKLKTTVVPKFQEKMREAFVLQKKIQRAVLKGKTKKQLKPMLDEITKLKREAIDHRIDALNGIKDFMSEEQWKKVNKLTYK